MGTYFETRPKPGLQRFFSRVWTYRAADQETEPFIVLPDGCVELMWIREKLFLAGPDTKAVRRRFSPGENVLGLRFRPAAASTWLGMPVRTITDQRIALEDIWGADGRGLAERLGDARTPADKARRLQEELLRRPSTEGDPPDSALERAFVLLRDGEETVRGVAERLQLSPRTLRRRCGEAFGYGPKTLARILRLQRFLSLTGRPGKSNLALLAVEAGYADQAHLSNEVRSLCGVSPKRVLLSVAR